MKDYTTKEPTDIMQTARELDELMKDFDWYEYNDQEYDVQKAFEDLENDPYMVVHELINMIRELWEHLED